MNRSPVHVFYKKISAFISETTSKLPLRKVKRLGLAATHLEKSKHPPPCYHSQPSTTVARTASKRRSRPTALSSGSSTFFRARAPAHMSKGCALSRCASSLPTSRPKSSPWQERACQAWSASARASHGWYLCKCETGPRQVLEATQAEP